MRWIQCAIAVWLLPAAQIATAQEVRSVAAVDLNRYVGQWFELASIPQFFQRKCVRDTTANYAVIEPGMVQVMNRCSTESGDSMLAEGRARVEDHVSNAKLKVTFLKFFGFYQFWASGDYWVIGLGDRYDWAVVGHPTREYGWVLSRTQIMSPEQWRAVSAVLAANGYDACKFIVSLQTTSAETKMPLCERNN